MNIGLYNEFRKTAAREIRAGQGLRGKRKVMAWIW
jgi:hypothetical protein